MKFDCDECLVTHINNASANGSVLTGNKPIPEPVLRWFCNAKWRPWANELSDDDAKQYSNMHRLVQCVMLSWWSLTHWGRVTHICVGKLTTIDSDNGLSPERRQPIIWTNAGMLLIGSLGTNFSEILIEIKISSFKKMRLKVSSAKWRPFCLVLNVLMDFWLLHSNDV